MHKNDKHFIATVKKKAIDIIVSLILTAYYISMATSGSVMVSKLD